MIPGAVGAVRANMTADRRLAALRAHVSDSPRPESAAAGAAVARNGGEALVQALAAHGARLVVGVPGAGQYEATDALYQHPTVRYVATRHEQAATYIADAFSRVTGEVGCALVVPGPGFYNAAAGLISADSVHSKVLAVTGAPHYVHGSSSATTQEDLALLRPMCKWAGRAETAAAIPAQVHSAFQQMHVGRPGCAVLEIAASQLAAEAAQHPEPPQQHDEATLGIPAAPAPSAAAVVQVGDLLRRAVRPLLWVGAGAAGASTAVEELASLLGCAVLHSYQGKGTLSDRHPLSLGAAELRFPPLKAWVDGCDVVITVGTAGAAVPPDATCVQIDVAPEPTAADRDPSQQLYLQADATQCLEAIVAQLSDLQPRASSSSSSGAGAAVASRRATTAAAVAEINAERFGPQEQLEPQAGYMAAIRAALPDTAVLVSGMNQMGYYCRSYFHCYEPRTFLTLTPHITLGAAYPYALGAKLGVDLVHGADAGVPCVAICGDGGFAYNIAELATAVQYDIPAIAIVFNDNAYGNVKRAQQDQFEGRVIGTELVNPDFVALAQSFGVRAARVPLAAPGSEFGCAMELGRLLAQAVEERKPWLIEVPVGAMERTY